MERRNAKISLGSSRCLICQNALITSSEGKLVSFPRLSSSILKFGGGFSSLIVTLLTVLYVSVSQTGDRDPTRLREVVSGFDTSMEKQNAKISLGSSRITFCQNANITSSEEQLVKFSRLSSSMFKFRRGVLSLTVALLKVLLQ